jgi:hypothetical protein
MEVPMHAKATTAAVDVGALAAAIKNDVVHDAAEALVLGFSWCEERQGAGSLNELQKILLTEATLDSFQSIETKIRAELERTIPVELHWPAMKAT